MWFRVNSVAAILFQLHPHNQGDLSRRRAFSSSCSWSFRVLPTASGATVVGAGGFLGYPFAVPSGPARTQRCPLPSHCGLLLACSTLWSGGFMILSVSWEVTWCPLLRSSVCSRAQDIPEVVCQKHLVLCPRGHGLPPEPQGSALWFSPWVWPQTQRSIFSYHWYLHHRGFYWPNGRRCWWLQPGPAVGVLHAVQCPGPARLSHSSGDTPCPDVSGTSRGWTWNLNNFPTTHDQSSEASGTLTTSLWSRAQPPCRTDEEMEAHRSEEAHSKILDRVRQNQKEHWAGDSHSARKSFRNRVSEGESRGAWSCVSVMVNFMCKYAWLIGCPIADKILFLGVSTGMFLEEINICVSVDGVKEIRRSLSLPWHCQICWEFRRKTRKFI